VTRLPPKTRGGGGHIVSTNLNRPSCPYNENFSRSFLGPP
jgi:hypothetical protein